MVVRASDAAAVQAVVRGIFGRRRSRAVKGGATRGCRRRRARRRRGRAEQARSGLNGWFNSFIDAASYSPPERDAGETAVTRAAASVR